MMAERGALLVHATILRWVQRYVPEFEKHWSRYARPVGRLIQDFENSEAHSPRNELCTRARSIVDHLRWGLNNVFKTALADGLVDSNPAAALFTPACKAEGERGHVARGDSRSIQKPDLVESTGEPAKSTDSDGRLLKMVKTFDPFRFLLISVAGWMNQRQQHAMIICARRTESSAPSLGALGFGSLTTNVTAWQLKRSRSDESCWPTWQPLSRPTPC